MLTDKSYDCFGNIVNVGDIIVCHEDQCADKAKILVTSICNTEKKQLYERTYHTVRGLQLINIDGFKSLRRTFRTTHRFIKVYGEMEKDIRKEFDFFKIEGK